MEEVAAEAAEAAKSSGSGGDLVTLVLEGAAMTDFRVVYDFLLDVGPSVKICYLVDCEQV